jgi:hypothetical protein
MALTVIVHENALHPFLQQSHNEILQDPKELFLLTFSKQRPCLKSKLTTKDLSPKESNKKAAMILADQRIA